MSKKDKKAEKRKKQNVQDQHRLLSMNETELIKEGDALIESGNARDAIKIYQMAIKIVSSKIQSGSSLNYAASNTTNQNTQKINFLNEIKVKLFNAYITRSSELKNKNMLSEAKTMENQAIAAMPDISFLDSSAMASFLLLCSSPDKAFKSYNEFYIQKKKSSVDLQTLNISHLERILAEILIEHNCWEHIDTLNDDITLKKDAYLVKPALLFMNQGEWDKALESMKAISRSSPFAHIRLFCKAMSAFYRDNNSEMLKAISMIPKDSIFINITDELKHDIDIQVDDKSEDDTKNKTKIYKKEQKLNSKRNLEIRKCLWSGPFEIYDKLENIISCAKNENYNDYLQKNIIEFAQLLMPNHTSFLIQFLLETLCVVYSNKHHQFFKMVEKILNKKGKNFKIKSDAVFTDEIFISGLEYFKILDQEFSTIEEQNIAKAMIISHIIKAVIKENAYPFVIRSIRKKPDYPQLVGITSKDGKIAAFEMLLFAIKLDPQNRELYDILDKIPLSYHYNEAKNIIETILLTKCDAFPNDPEPRLQLASFYYSKNAYRKAENILKKALELAPHDTKVLDQHAVSLLISADRSACKKKFNLSWQDIEKAKQLNSKQCAILIAEKSIFYKIAETGQVNENEIEEQLKLYSISDKLKCYALLMADMEDKLQLKKINITDKTKKSDQNALYLSVELLFKKELMKLGELTSIDILSLLLPLPKEWSHLSNKITLISYFLSNSKGLLKHLEDIDLLTLIEKIDYCSLYPAFITELNSRIKSNNQKGSKNRKLINNSNKLDSKILEFYKLTLKYLVNLEKSYNFHGFSIYREYLRLLNKLDSETEKILKEASKKLSKKADGRFKDALETFNFEILLQRPVPFSFFDDDDSDDNINPFDFAGGFDPFKLPEDFDLSSIPPFLIEQMLNDLKNSNTAASKNFKKLLNEVISDLEELVDDLDLRGKSEQELKKMRKSIVNHNETIMKIEFVNLFYKEEAIKKFSREAKILFIE